MTPGRLRPRSRETPNGRRATTGAASSALGPAQASLLFAALLMAAVFAGCLRSQDRPSARGPQDDAAARPALAESTRMALQHSDWERAQSLLDRLLRHDPRDPTLLLASAQVLHNRVWLPPEDGRSRSPCRTALDRMTAECRALALMDSAAACAPDPAGRVKARLRVAQVYQHVGLYLDALAVYREIESVERGRAEVTQPEAQIVQLMRR